MLLRNLSLELVSSSPPERYRELLFQSNENTKYRWLCDRPDAFYSNTKGYETVSVPQQVLLKSKQHADPRLKVFACFQAAVTKLLLADPLWERAK